MSMKFYFWKDIYRFFQLNKKKWLDNIKAVDVYPSVVRIYTAGNITDDQVKLWLKDLLPRNFDPQEFEILLDLGEKSLPIICDDSEDYDIAPVLPIFRSVLYQEASYPSNAVLNPATLNCKVIAFHSYKGGVGRTLSLLTFAKAWATVFEKDNPRVLIIDSDIEAPGLSWLRKEEPLFSYLDLLTLIQDNDEIDEIVKLACSKIGDQTITVETENRTVDHIFLPTCRIDDQLLDIYAEPSTIINGKDKEYVLASVLSKIGEKLKVSAVLVDLRAGLSDFSSTLLFDPRVKKYITTSTSSQSIIGTKIILRYLLKGLLLDENTVLPEILLNMIPASLYEHRRDELEDIISDLCSVYDAEASDENNNLMDNVVTELSFANDLVHLTDLTQILGRIKTSSMYATILKLIRQNYKLESPVPLNTNLEREEIVNRIHRLAESQITAEDNVDFNLFMTESIKYLRKKYKGIIPTTVIMGAKGAGKTFLYREIVKDKSWSSFYNRFEDNLLEINIEDYGFCLPLFASKNNPNIIPALSSCINNFNSQIGFANVPVSIYLDNAKKLTDFIRNTHDEVEWCDFWEQLIASSISNEYKSLYELNYSLLKEKKQIVILIDGIEEILKRTVENSSQKIAVYTLCQNVTNLITASCSQIGIITFLRKDMARNAINVNFTQFEQIYKNVELKWSTAETLKLVVWLVDQAYAGFYKGEVEISEANHDTINRNLTKLWGEKLGLMHSREAFSSLWILTALSDFNGQLQARDIIRFLKYATERTGQARYDDRIIMPAEIKAAINKASEEKIGEIQTEIVALEPIFDKLRKTSPDKKILPFTKEQIELEAQEEKIMQQEGYLIIESDKYYLPEIARHALGFSYIKGARPKVLSLLRRRQ